MSWILRYYRSTLGKKTMMAATGIILFGYIVLHLLGNLQIYAGPDRINAYAKFLHANPALVWAVRIVLIFCVLVHMLAAFQVWWRSRQSRDVKYRMFRPPAVDYAAKTMIYGGVIIALYVVFHIFDLTIGSIHPGFVEGQVYANLVHGFQIWWLAAIYIVANLVLGVHLYHGLWSLFQTLGWEHPRWNPARRWFAVVVSVLIAAGFVSIPVSIFTGLVR